MRYRNRWVVLAVVLALMGLTACDNVWKSDRYTAKGVSFLEKRQYQEAEPAFKEAIRIRRENGSAHYYLALLYLATNRYEKAVSLMQFYIEYADRTRAWIGPRDDEYLAKIKALYIQQTGEIPVRGVSE
jgi:tetratricopeptide (TPR) repeat protein